MCDLRYFRLRQSLLGQGQHEQWSAFWALEADKAKQNSETSKRTTKPTKRTPILNQHIINLSGHETFPVDTLRKTHMLIVGDSHTTVSNHRQLWQAHILERTRDCFVSCKDGYTYHKVGILKDDQRVVPNELVSSNDAQIR